ncbi:Protein of unknown function DUF2184 [uncultured Caudovirales phage]|uniref:Major capsid protein n=1 Tax=uncultured Caudovirales phage TaxID=2100421 RepID=A0A6J5RJF7_9CAUD|nr:Protein of unknown function DUF2184 [uncultured Caudovirales phage]
MTDKNMHYDSQDFRAIEASGRLDANEGIFFSRQLESIKSQAYDVKRAKLNALEIMPVSTSTPEGATTITYRQYDSVGAAKIIANYANDMPRADVSGKEFTSPIRGIGIAYGYNMQEIRSAQYSGTPLSEKKMRAAQRAHEELINKLAWAGDVENGLPGFMNNTNIPAFVVPAVGTGSSKLWNTKSADQIIADVNGIINQVQTQSKGIHRANTVMMPLEQYAYISSTPRSATTDTTILAFVQANNPGVTFRAVIELDAFNGGLDRMVAGEFSIDNMQLEIPMAFRQYSPQQQGLEFVIPCESRFGGVIIEYPLAFALADSI